MIGFLIGVPVGAFLLLAYQNGWLAKAWTGVKWAYDFVAARFTKT